MLTTAINNRSTNFVHKYIVGFVLVLVFFLLSFPENRTENDDGYYYALRIKTQGFEQLGVSKFVLFLPIFKGLYMLAQGLSPIPVDAYLFMCIANSIFSALFIVLFFHVLHKMLHISLPGSMIGTGFLLFSYGNWRYAVEADVYPLANLAVIVTLFFLIKAFQNTKTFWQNIITAGVLGGFTVLIYKPVFITVFLCFPVFLLLKKKYVPSLVYVSLVGIVIFTGYLIAYMVTDTHQNTFMSYLMGGATSSKGSPLMAILMLPTKFISPNFIYGFDTIISFIQQKFPTYMIDEEVFAAKRFPFLNFIALVTAIIFGLTFIALISRSIIKKYIPKNLNAFSKMILVWMVLYALVLLKLDPNSPEPWNMVLLPLTFIFVFIIAEPYLKHSTALLPIILITSLFLHNLFGGFATIYGKDNDHASFKGDWVIEHSTKDDVILSLGSSNLLYYLAYHSDAEVWSLERHMEKGLLAAKQTKGKVYLTEEVLNPSISVKKRNARSLKKLNEFLSANPDKIILANEGSPLGKVYQLEMN